MFDGRRDWRNVAHRHLPVQVQNYARSRNGVQCRIDVWMPLGGRAFVYSVSNSDGFFRVLPPIADSETMDLAIAEGMAYLAALMDEQPEQPGEDTFQDAARRSP